MNSPLRYASLYQYKGPLGEYQFMGHWHETREGVNRAAAHELSVERNTRRIAIIRLKTVKPS